jgi:hypothetical protein
MRTILFTLILAVAACGGAETPAPVEPPTGTEPVVAGEHEHQQEEHPEMTAEMHELHDVLAPLWHSETPDRQDKTCESAGSMLALAEKVQNAANPGADQAAWEGAVQQLMTSIVTLMDQCKAGGDFEANFKAVHDAFHGLLDLLPKKEA